MTPTDIQQSAVKHAVMAQMHRWYQSYEKAQTSIDNQIDAVI
jgi:hypothetical protein